MKSLIKPLFALSLAVFVPTLTLAENINVLAAASLKYVLEDIKSEFLKTHKNDSIQVSYISSGKAYAQIQNGSPTHLFIAADTEYPQKLYDEKLAAQKPINYAKGKLVLISAHKNFTLKQTATTAQIITALKNQKLTHIAIPNPKLAPYGKAALEFLTTQGLDKALQSKLSVGDSIGQATSFVLEGASEIGFSALSMVIKDNKTPNLSYALIDEATYAPINQALIVPKYGKDSKLAADFADFIVHSSQSQKLLQSYGYDVPDSE